MTGSITLDEDQLALILTALILHFGQDNELTVPGVEELMDTVPAKVVLSAGIEDDRLVLSLVPPGGAGGFNPTMEEIVKGGSDAGNGPPVH